ncbi:hypothetical protein Efla_005998 [Eimeria flavescens]
MTADTSIGGSLLHCSGAPPAPRKLVVLRSCSEVHVHRSLCGRFRAGFDDSSSVLAATAEQQQQQQQQQQFSVGPRRRIGFVPTLGGLHEGHLSLVAAARRMCDEVWVSIFLNPTQFDNPTDLLEYPASLQQDIQLLQQQAAADVIFVPSLADMYPQLYAHQQQQQQQQGAAGAAVKERVPFADVEVTFRGVDDILGEGSRRPGFFKGNSSTSSKSSSRGSSELARQRAVAATAAAATAAAARAAAEGAGKAAAAAAVHTCFCDERIGQVILKLFSLVRPTHAFFGQKDFLQTVCMRSFCRCSLNGCCLLVCPTARNEKGLPFSTRNQRLNQMQFKTAENSIDILRAVEAAYLKGERRLSALTAAAAAAAAGAGAPVYYLTFNRQGDGAPLGEWVPSPAKEEGGPQKEEGAPCLLLPENEEICIAMAVKAAELSTIVDNFVVSDTHRHGNLLPAPPNTPEAIPSAAASLLPLHAAPSVLLLRSQSLRLLRVAPAAAAAAAAADTWAELEALELTDTAVCQLSAAARSSLWPWCQQQQQQQQYYYVLKDCREGALDRQPLVAYLCLDVTQGGAPQPLLAAPAGSSSSAAAAGGAAIRVQRIFVAPNRRRQGLAEALFGACMLVLHQQLQQQQQQHIVSCVVPQYVAAYLESMGFSRPLHSEALAGGAPGAGPLIGGAPKKGAPKEGPPYPSLCLSASLEELVRRQLRP